MKKIASVLFGLLFSAGVAMAVTGTQPTNGPQLIDGTYVNALAAGQNATYQSGLTAAGSTQAGALQLTPGFTLMQIDAVASGTGVALPSALAGTEISIYNNGANTLTVYPSIVNNPATAAQDTINNSTSTTVSSHSSLYCFSAKNGVLACK